ncbi:TonB-dependent receptor [Sphingomonas ginsenosidivorax]|uniref:TonB-dependent receptor n=1 Tax=Sphingomonas ginsenosidivorax TaxID=862135 RepID=A0A5C6UHF9_9SPHN|nr:TonB-dependent receptor [Sphingomonas ginsenosidivorax]TXC71636.1 TonB-dependent receptor [Sphingomonas ginsenosidivorax]
MIKTFRAALAAGVAVGAMLGGVAQAQTVPATAAATAAAADPTDAPDIVVTGTRAGERKAIEEKRSADNFVEAIFANDVGKLPDQNVAEAVRRIPGLSVANDQGEGRYVIVRGINPDLVNVTLNGMTLPAPEPEGRQVKLDDIPSALINAVVVTKSLTADQDANAIGGSVDIRTLSAFDRNKPYFADARAAYGWSKLNGKHPYEGDVQVGGLFGPDGQFGAVLSVNYSKRPIESENFQGSTNYRVATAANGFVVPDQYGLRDYNLTRTRKGAVLNLDWRPSDTTKIFLRGTYSAFDDSETRDQFIIDNQSAFTNQTATTGTFRGRGSVRVRRRQEADTTKSVQGGGEFAVGPGQLAISGGYARAQKRDPLRSEYNFRTGGTALTVNYDVSDAPYDFVPGTTLAQTAYTLNSVNYDRRLAVERLAQGRVDYTIPLAFGSGGSSVKIGGKYLDRHKTNNRDYQTYGLTAGRTFTLANVSYLGDTSFYGGDYSFGPRIGYDTAEAFLAANPGTVTLNAAGSVNNSLANDYDVKERIIAGYAMATLKFDRLTLVPGVRVEHTRDRSQAKLITATTSASSGFNSFGSKQYTDVFPGLNARYDVADDLVLRAAVTTAIGRPNYAQLAPFVSVDTTTNPVSVAQGNPDLKPYKALNFDGAIEYYLPGQGLISVGGFYKRLDDPIYQQVLLGQTGSFAGQALTNASVSTPLNIDKAKVYGIEVNLQTRFTFLPSPLDGFGVSANYTRIWGDGNGTVLGATPRTGDIPLFLQSKHVGTAQLFYEKYGFAVRAAYSYRSAYLDTLGATAAQDQYTDRNGQLDVNASYQVTPELTFFANATNLTDAPWRRYIGTKAQLVERERYDLSVRWGAQLHF